MTPSVPDPGHLQLIWVYLGHSCDTVASDGGQGGGWGSSPHPPPPFNPVPKTGGGFSRELTAGITQLFFPASGWT